MGETEDESLAPRLSFWSGWLVVWLSLLWHYSQQLREYASISGWWLEHPVIYIATESWVLLSVAMVMVLGYVIVKEVLKRRVPEWLHIVPKEEKWLGEMLLVGLLFLLTGLAALPLLIS